MPLHRLHMAGHGTVHLWDTRHLALASRRPTAVALWTTLPLLIGVVVMVYGVGVVGNPDIPGRADRGLEMIRSGAAIFFGTGAVCVVSSLILGALERRGQERAFITSVEIPGVSADDLSVLVFDDILSIPSREALACLADGEHAEAVVEMLTNVVLDESAPLPGRAHPRVELSSWYRHRVSPA